MCDDLTMVLNFFGNEGEECGGTILHKYLVLFLFTSTFNQWLTIIDFCCS